MNTGLLPGSTIRSKHGPPSWNGTPCGYRFGSEISIGQLRMKSSDDFDITRREFVLIGTAAVAATTPLVASGEAAHAEPPPVSKVSFKVNGQACNLDLDTRTTLLDALREH